MHGTPASWETRKRKPPSIMNEVRVIDCEEALRRLFEYLDAELRGESQREMDQHLERCRSCFSRVEFEKRLKTYTAEAGREPVPSDLELRIRKVLSGFKC
jgi:mycothiol system anti-sigma-R factor